MDGLPYYQFEWRIRHRGSSRFGILGHQTRRYDDMPAHIIDIAQHVIVPEAKDGPAAALEKRCSLDVLRSVLGFCMLTSIDLDNDAMRGASEIGDVLANRNLPPEAETHQSMRT